MFGGAGNDVIHGSDRWDRMQGGAGQDQLFGYEGRDWMRGGADTDLVDGGIGIDDLHGGNGADAVRVTAGDVVRGGAGLDRCVVDGTAGMLRSCEANARVAVPLPTARVNGVSLTTNRCRKVKQEISAFETFQAAEGVIRNDSDELRDININVSVFDAAGRQVDDLSTILRNLEPGTSSAWSVSRTEAFGGKVLPDFATCVVQVEDRVGFNSTVPGDEYNATTTCQVARRIENGLVVSSMNGTVTNTTDAPIQMRVEIYGYDASGLRDVSSASLPGVDEFIAPGETLAFTTTRVGDFPTSFERCSMFVTPIRLV